MFKAVVAVALPVSTLEVLASCVANVVRLSYTKMGSVSQVRCGVGLLRCIPGEANTASIVVSKQKTTAEPAVRGITIFQSSSHD
jgi:hypothetical protein